MYYSVHCTVFNKETNSKLILLVQCHEIVERSDSAVIMFLPAVDKLARYALLIVTPSLIQPVPGQH